MTMTSTTTPGGEAFALRIVPDARVRSRSSALSIMGLAAWCGLAAGLLEVGSRVACRAISPTRRLFLMTRHFYWLSPLANLLVFLVLGMALVAITKVWPRLGAWLYPRILCALAIVPMFIVAVPQIYPEANLVLAFGVAMRLVPWLAGRPIDLRKRLAWTFPALAGAVVILAGTVFGSDWLKERHEASRPLPPAGSPNVLFIVLDTVRADRLSLYGYHRRRRPALERLAKAAFASTPRARLRPGPSPHMPASSAAAGRMRWASNGRHP